MGAAPETRDRPRDLHPTCLLNVLDLAERAGIACDLALGARALTRADLQRGTWVSWDDYRTIVESLAAAIGGEDAFCAHAEELVEIGASEMGAFTSLPLPALTILRFLNLTLGPRLMRCIEFGSSSRARAHLTLSMRLHDGLEGSRTVFRFLATATSGLASCLPVVVEDVEYGPRGFSYSVVSRSRRERRMALAPEAPAIEAWLELVEKDRSAVRRNARSTTAKELGQALSHAADLRTLLDAVTRALRDALRAHAVEIRVDDERVGSVSACCGEPAATPHTRMLRRADGGVLGRAIVHAPSTSTVEAYAALDLVVEWIASSIDDALQGSDHERGAVFAAHPGPVFELDAIGGMHPINDHARAAAAGELRRDHFELVPIGVPSRVSRVVALERGARDRIDRRLTQAASVWALTARQKDVVAHIARGASNAQIASTLGVTIQTVENHLTMVFRKVGVDSRYALIARILGEA